MTEQRAFQNSKKLLLSSQVLVHYDPSLEVILACDASSYGVGAVLSHKMADGSERPVAFASRTLSAAEQRYSQIEKEGLACVFGVKRFHLYLYGRRFTLITDHKPLLQVFDPHRSISSQVSGRLQRGILTLAGYEYKIMFRRTFEHSNADGLSRLPIQHNAEDVSEEAPEVVLLMRGLQDSPVDFAQIKAWTGKDPVLAQVLAFVRTGWPEKEPKAQDGLAPYWIRRAELSTMDGCILWCNRVVVPPRGREYVLRELHGGHPGVVRMKGMARMFVWWPGIDKAVEEMVESCVQCQSCRSSPQVAPLQPWAWPTRPWVRLHIDYAGPLLGRMLLVVVDGHAEWIEAEVLEGATSECTIRKLRAMFARYGLPETIVSDNGACFTSREFTEFLKSNCIRHITTAPYHPASNGMAERAVKIVKDGLKKLGTGDLREKLARFLFQYRITPQSTTGLSPGELLFGRRLRSRLDALRPNAAERVERKQEAQKRNHDMTAKRRSFTEGDDVYVKVYKKGGAWEWAPGCIAKCTGPLSFVVQLKDGRYCRRHQDQIRKRSTGCLEEWIPTEDVTEIPNENEQEVMQEHNDVPRPVGAEERLDDYDGAVREEAEQGGGPNRQVPDVREPEGRPRRNRKQVEKYQAGFS